LFSCYFF